MPLQACFIDTWGGGDTMFGPKSVLGPREPESFVPYEKCESQVKTQSFRPVPETHNH